MMKTLKFIVLLTVMLVNLTPYIKDGKLEWKANEAAAQLYTIEYDYAHHQYLCADHDKPNDPPFFSSLKCEKAPVVEGRCVCDYCEIEHPCLDTCKYMDCPEKTRNKICPICEKPLNYNEKCINCSCYNSICYVAPPTGGGGGGSNDGSSGSNILPARSIPYTKSMYEQTGGYIEKMYTKNGVYIPGTGCDCMCVAQKIMRQLLGSDAYIGSSSNKMQLYLENPNGVLCLVGDANNIFNTLNSHLDANHPMIVGVDYTPLKGRNEGTTDHWVVITGRGYDSEAGQYYFNFIETGHYASSSTKAVADDNRLYYDRQAGTFKDNTGGTKRQQKYSLTQIRPNL